MKRLLLLILISLSTFIVSSPYTSVYPSTVSNPVNISQTSGNIIIEQNSLNPQIATVGKKVYIVWEEDVQVRDRPVGEGLLDNGLVNDLYFRRSTEDVIVSDIYFKKSTDGGTTFDKTINLSNVTGKALNPHVTVSGSNVYVAWIHGIGNTYSVYFKKSSDGGDSFDKTVNLSNISIPRGSELDFTISSELDSIIQDTRYPAVAASGSNVYVIWLDNLTKTTVQLAQSIQDNSTSSTTFDTPPIQEFEVAYNDIFYKRSTDGGDSFGNTIDLSNGTTVTRNPHLAVAGTNVYLVWDGIHFRRSTDGGDSFEPIVNITNGYNPQISASGTNVYVIYEKLYPYSSSLSEDTMKPQLFFIASNNTGTTFTRPILLSNNNGVAGGSEEEEDIAQMYVSGSNVYVVWPTDKIDKSQDLFDFHSDLYFRSSTDGGASFKPVVNLSNSVVSGYTKTPSVVANGSNLYITWRILVDKELPYHSGTQIVSAYIPVLAKSIDGGAIFDTLTSVTGSYSDLSISKSNAALVWSQAGEIFFRMISPALPLSSLRVSNIQSSNIHNTTEPIRINGKIGNAEWERIPSSSLEQLNNTNMMESDWERIPSVTHQWNDKEYQIKLASTYDNKDSYFVFGVQGTDFVGGSNLTLMFDNSHNGKLDGGDDILKILGGSDSTSSKDNFEDSFWNNATNQIQKDEDYGGTEDGHVASSFYNGTEVFEVSHPLCSSDNSHDFCITDPNEILGFSLKFEVNDTSALLFFNDLKDRDMYPFSLSKGGVYDDCPGCAGASPTAYIPPAAYILEPILRLSSSERTQLFSNLTSDERTELSTRPTEDRAKDFLMNKLTAEQLGDFLMNKLTAEETDKLFKSIPENDILNRLGEEDRRAVSDKLSSFQLTK